MAHTRRVAAAPRGRCGNAGLVFGGTLDARLNYAYYRAVHRGGTDPAGTGYLPATSGTVLAWKYADRIIGFKVSGHLVPKGGKLTVSGLLQFYASGWRNFGRQRVQVILRPAGSKNWYWIVRLQTNFRGNFSVTFTTRLARPGQLNTCGIRRTRRRVGNDLCPGIELGDRVRRNVLSYSIS